MILFTRVEARDFRTLLAHCVSGRPRGPAPPVVVAVRHGTARIAAATAGGVTLTLTTPASDQRDGFLVLPASVLAEVEGDGDEIVTLEWPSPTLGLIHWPVCGQWRTLPVELIPPRPEHEIPAAPGFAPVSAELLAALHGCASLTGADSGRLALAKVQLQGKAGRIVATDRKAALLWGGFELPFREDLLVPGVPVFGTNPLARVRDVRVGRTPTHLVLEAGAWTVSLPVDSRSGYPDVASLIPGHPPTIARLDGRDVTDLRNLLPALPGGGEENRTVTITATGSTGGTGGTGGMGSVKIRAQDLTTLAVRELTLCRSQASGPSVQVALDRRVLLRALALGCRALELTPDKPVVFVGESVTLVAAPIDPRRVAPLPPRPSPRPRPE